MARKVPNYTTDDVLIQEDQHVYHVCVCNYEVLRSRVIFVSGRNVTVRRENGTTFTWNPVQETDNCSVSAAEGLFAKESNAAKQLKNFRLKQLTNELEELREDTANYSQWVLDAEEDAHQIVQEAKDQLKNHTEEIDKVVQKIKELGGKVPRKSTPKKNKRTPPYETRQKVKKMRRN